MTTVKEILEVKGKEIIGVSPETTLLRALEVMADKNIGSVLVLDAQGGLAGIFSERDFVRKIIIKGRAMETTAVKEIMTSRVLYVTPETTIADCMSLMTEKRIRHLPVLEGGKAIGVVSIGDIVKELLKEQELMIDRQAAEIGQLERYTSGSI
jgi:signal-transduction protein with cAMP-binding, CBS, and nucleotidyltransferase domain